MDKEQQLLCEDSDSHSSNKEKDKDIMLWPRKKHTFKVEEILKAKVDLFGYPSPIHTHTKLVSMFKDAKLDTKL